MPLLVEDGTKVANANSYVETDYASAYAASRGLTLPTDDAALLPLLVRAFDYLEAKRALYKGVKTYPDGAQWPRTGVDIDGEAIAETVIPEELKRAQVRLAVELHNGVDFEPTVTEQVKREKIGPIDTEYVTGLAGPQLMAVDNLLAPLLRQTGAFSLTTKRG